MNKTPKHPATRRAALTLAAAMLTLTLTTHAAPAPDKSAKRAATLPAFPGAEGFGSGATGGRGGEIYHVINLSDAGPGSFRDAVSKGNRIVVFDVGGYIELRSPVAVAGNITIAGQTAPGDGIGTKNEQISFSNAENIIVRYMRFRGGIDGRPGKDGASIFKGKRQIFDHISVAWGRDETFSINESEDITVQNSIIAEGLLRHSMGGLVQWNTISLHHNLYSTNNDRNPKAKGKIDFVNNVVYNWGQDAFVAGGSAGRSDVNVVGNYFIAGPSSKRLDDPISRGNLNFHLYMDGNFFDADRNGKIDGKAFSRSGVDDIMVWEPTRYDYPGVTIQSAPEACRQVLASAGASLVRDAVDKRLIQNVVTGQGALITDPATVGGFGVLRTAPSPTDTDRDGMPDSWEKTHGLDPKNPKDASGDFDRTGYTNIEKYINGLVKG